MRVSEQIPLDRPFCECSPEFRKAVRDYFFNTLPSMVQELDELRNLGVEASLEAFEMLVQAGGVRFVETVPGHYEVILFNLFTGVYEEITTLVKDLEEDSADEDCGY